MQPYIRLRHVCCQDSALAVEVWPPATMSAVLFFSPHYHGAKD